MCRNCPKKNYNMLCNRFLRKKIDVFLLVLSVFFVIYPLIFEQKRGFFHSIMHFFSRLWYNLIIYCLSLRRIRRAMTTLVLS